MRTRSFVFRLSLLAVAVFGPASAHGAVDLFFNGFETDTYGWFGANRVPSGTNGIASSTGSYHATYGTAPNYTTFGATTTPNGYNFGVGNGAAVAFQEYWTSIDIYLDVDAGWSNDTRFDFTSAINNSSGGHRRDFAFNAGFYSDNFGPGAGTNRFVISASNNTGRSNSYPKNPDRDPIAIDTTGWYTFEHHFYENNLGRLAVDLSIYDSYSSLLHSWTLSDPSDLIGLIGGNRYGWFPQNEFSVLAFDNSRLSINPVPEAGSLFAWSVLGLAAGGSCWLRRRTKSS
jgi:hypothetical protein